MLSTLSGKATLIKKSPFENAFTPISFTGKSLYSEGIFNSSSVQVPMPDTI